MKTALSPMVGRAWLEHATNGLKARYALHARGAFTLRAGRMAGLKWLFSPALCQIPPTYTGATP